MAEDMDITLDKKVEAAADPPTEPKETKVSDVSSAPVVATGAAEEKLSSNVEASGENIRLSFPVHFCENF